MVPPPAAIAASNAGAGQHDQHHAFTLIEHAHSAIEHAHTVTGSRSAVEAELGLQLDPFQLRAFDALDNGASVLVAAPTGSGKTVVAQYAVHRAQAEGTKVFYTTPLKALSNQKYGDFVRQYGASQVGLLTGDNSVNGEAPIVVMTTEVLRNMIYAGSSTLDGLRYVVLDEVHYLQNRYRGAVWEEVIIHLPPTVDLVCLSATVSNAEEVADWIATVRGRTTAIIEETRPVELTNLYAVADRHTGEISVLPTFVPGTGTELTPNPEATRLDARGSGRDRGRPRSRLAAPRRSDLVEWLHDHDMLPAIVFIFSRAACDDAVRQCLSAGLRLTTAEERTTLRAIADERSRPLADDDLDALGYNDWLSGFEAGISCHHAGLVPPLKEAVEEAFAAGLVRVVFATETLSLGINMPARTVAIEKLSKFTGEHHEFLTPGEYTQLTGRAGRRGIDPQGFAVACWNRFVPFEQVAGLASRRSSALSSSFRPTYNMATNLVARYSPETAHRLLNLSFAQYHADRDVVKMERHLEHNEATLARRRADATCDRGDIGEYRDLLQAAEQARRDGRGHRHDDEPSQHLAARDAVAHHPVAGCPQLQTHLKSVVALHKLDRETRRLERRVRARSESLARQFDRVLGVLDALGYVDGWSLTDAGELLCRIYSETDLLVAHALSNGLLQDFTPGELAAFMSCFTYEHRGPDHQAVPPPVWPTSRVSQRYRDLNRLWRELHAHEADAGLPETRAPDPGLADSMHAWATGDSLADILDDDDDLTGGDFVRCVKQVVDLLRQLADAAPDPETRATAAAAAAACFRGVIAASSVVAS